jgi:putative colanic acid biosynthesis glycosyltransferase WcaI
VLIGILQADAGRFSVPSKILSYLCAARPIVLSAPAENLASRTVTAADAGVAVSAGDANGFSSATVAFLMDADRRARAGRNGRAYAERTFEIRAIAYSKASSSVRPDTRFPAAPVNHDQRSVNEILRVCVK